MIPEGFIDGTALLHSGVYLLAWRGEVVYVGQSGRLSARINTHCYSRGKFRKQTLSGRVVRGVVFDQIWFRPVPVADLDRVEQELIRELKPKYNIVRTPCGPTPPEIQEMIERMVAGAIRPAPFVEFNRRGL